MGLYTISLLFVAVVAVGIAKKVPKPIRSSCQIRWEDFEDITLTPTFWVSLYMVDFRTSETSRSGNLMTLHTQLDSSTYQLQVSHWTLAAGDEEVDCLSHDSPYIKFDDLFVVLRKQVGFPISFTYLSRRPEQYILNSACFGPLDEDGVCPEPVVYVMVPDLRPDSNGDGVPDGPLKLTGTQWSYIGKDLRDCVGVTFEDTAEPLAEWIWDGQDCPFPSV